MFGSEEERSREFNDDFNEILEEQLHEQENSEPYKRLPLGFNRPGDEFPTEWQVRDGFAREEWRQTSEDTYEVRNPEDIMVMSKAGWYKYNEGAIAFLEWLNENEVTMRSRADG